MDGDGGEAVPDDVGGGEEAGSGVMGSPGYTGWWWSATAAVGGRVFRKEA